jgi:hypothetical protein
VLVGGHHPVHVKYPVISGYHPNSNCRMDILCRLSNIASSC